MFSRNSPIAMMTNKISAESPNPCVTELWESLSLATFFIDRKFKKRTRGFHLGQRFWKWAKSSTCRMCVGLNMKTMSSIAPTFKFEKMISTSQPNLFIANLRDWATELHQSSSNFQMTPSKSKWLTRPQPDLQDDGEAEGKYSSNCSQNHPAHIFNVNIFTELFCSYFQCKYFHGPVVLIFWT